MGRRKLSGGGAVDSGALAREPVGRVARMLTMLPVDAFGQGVYVALTIEEENPHLSPIKS